MFAALVSERYGINPQEYGFKRVVADLQTEAIRRGAKIDVRRLTHYDSSTNCLYVSRFDGYMHKLDGKAVTLLQNGDDNVFFLDDVTWEPYCYSANSAKGLCSAPR